VTARQGTAPQGTAPRASTAAQDTAGRQLAARQLLVTPILTAGRHPEQLALVRRHATALKSIFATQLGYALVVESSFARLVKVPLPPAAPTRPARRATDDSPFGPSTYTHLALICAALLAPGIGEQTLISALVEQVRADAAAQSILVTDSITDRRHLVTALGMLIGWGVLSETDGSVAAWGERRQDEALLTVHRPLLAHLLPVPLHALQRPADAWTVPPTDSPRRRLRRRLVENPVVFRVDLDEDERDALSRERSELTRQLEENFGLTLEVRAEGALAYDATGQLTDVEFPGAGSCKQAALLLLDELVTALRPAPESTVPVGGTAYPGILAGWVEVDRILGELVARHRRAWRSAYVDSPDQLRADVVALLESLGLVAPTDAGLAVFPFGARYRPAVRAAPDGRQDLCEEDR
jgi:uncharacterized protein (TIGR02678 family)